MRVVVKNCLCVSVVKLEVFFCFGFWQFLLLLSGSENVFPGDAERFLFKFFRAKSSFMYLHHAPSVPQLKGKLMTETSRNHGGIVRLGCN